MKTTISSIFDRARAGDIEYFLNTNNVPNISPDTISSIKAQVFAKTKISSDQKNSSFFKRWHHYVIAAACLCLIMAMFFSVPMLKKDNSSINDPNSVSDSTSTKSPLPLFAPGTFTSFEDFEKHEKEAGEKAVKYYYKPSVLTQDYEFSQITKRDDIYVMIEYTLSSNRNVSDEKLSDYDAQRMSTLLCQTSLYPDGKKTLEESFINNGFEEIEYKGKVYYRMDEHADNDPNKQITAYEILFLIDNDLIFMHLPAIDTFENMMKFAQVTKVVID